MDGWRLARRVTLGAVFGLCGLTAAPAVVPESGGSAGALSFTAAQADHGEALYMRQCTACHGASLEGGSGVPLAGPRFLGRWGGKAAADLHEVMSRQMPLTAPGSLVAADYIDLLAFILSRNGLEPGLVALGPNALSARLPSAEGGSAAKAAARAAPRPRLPGAPKLYGTAAGALPGDADLRRADDAEWLMYNRDYPGRRFSGLDQVTAANAHQLAAVCAFQLGETGWFSPSPVIYRGILYVTGPYSTFAIDARTCRKIWKSDYPPGTLVPAAVVNRGVALYRGAVYRGTPNGHLLALDAKDGRPLWDVWVADVARGNWLSAAPLAFDGKVFIGLAGADTGAPGHFYAFDAATGKHLWTFDFIPIGKQPGAETWKKGASTGGGSSWSGYSADPDKGLIYVSVGNPAPDFNGALRAGDNLYTDSVVALEAATGKLAWYVQQIPHDTHDWDTAAPATLYDQAGKSFMAVANKGGWLYIYDRASHGLLAQPEVTTHSNSDKPPTLTGMHACPGVTGGTQWNGPAYSPADKALYVNSVDWCATYTLTESRYIEGSAYMGGEFTMDSLDQARGWVRSFDAATGRQNWADLAPTPMVAGLTPTAGGVLLTGDLNGDFLAMEARTGKILYRFNTGGAIAGGISTYLAGGRQYIAVPSGNASRTVWGTTGAATIFIFGLPPNE